QGSKFEVWLAASTYPPFGRCSLPLARRRYMPQTTGQLTAAASRYTRDTARKDRSIFGSFTRSCVVRALRYCVPREDISRRREALGRPRSRGRAAGHLRERRELLRG